MIESRENAMVGKAHRLVLDVLPLHRKSHATTMHKIINEILDFSSKSSFTFDWTLEYWFCPTLPKV